MEPEIANWTLSEAATAVREHRISSAELAEACLSRIERLDPILGCFIALEAEDARKAAQSADTALARGCLRGPLHGVPLAHKDIFYRAGKVSSGGSRVLAEVVRTETCTIMRRLDKAGAVNLGRLAMSEFYVGGSSGRNDAFGVCRNPWSTSHVPGGSSSGSAAAVAARLVYGSLASDTGGSIRNPASFCGVVGLKTTQGRVSNAGTLPRGRSLDTIGPIARTCRDCASLLAIITDADSSPLPALDTRLLKSGIQNLRIGVPEQYFLEDLDDRVAAAMEESLRVFRSLGATIVSVAVPDMQNCFRLASTVTRPEATVFHRRWLEECREDYTPAALKHIEAGFEIAATDYVEAIFTRDAYQREFVDTAFSKCDVLHTPVNPIATPRCEVLEAGGPEAERLEALIPRNTRPINYLGLPAIAVPCGFIDGLLPVGFQLIGKPFDEATLLCLGHAYERETEWYRHAPSTNEA